MSEIRIRRQENPDELCHYGVLGMKWGVHRASRNYKTATDDAGRQKARNSMEKHLSKASKKLNAHNTKTTKLLNKAIKKRYGVFGSNEKYEQTKVKAERAAYKGHKWYKQMEKTFAKQSIVSISNKDKAIGAKLDRFFDQHADFRNSKYNEEY